MLKSLKLDNPKNRKSKMYVIQFCVFFITYGGLTLLTEYYLDDEKSLVSILFQITLFSLVMSIFMVNQGDISAMYFKPGAKDKLLDHMKSRGYKVKKEKDGTIFLKKSGFNLTLFKAFEIKESSFYTKLYGSQDDINSVPDDIERIRTNFLDE